MFTLTSRGHWWGPEVGSFHLAVTDRPSQHITAHSSFSLHLHPLFSFVAQLHEDRTMLCMLSSCTGISTILPFLYHSSLLLVLSARLHIPPPFQYSFQVFVHCKCDGLTRCNTHHAWCDSLVETVDALVFPHVTVPWLATFHPTTVRPGLTWQLR
jgi:hypothetical protein